MKKSLRLILSVMAITILSQCDLLAWSEPTQITTTGGASAPSLIQDSSGKYWVAFSYSGDVHISSSLDGIVWSTPTDITNWGNCSWSSLIQDAGGIYRLAFGAGSAEPYKIYVMSSSDGLGWSSPVQVPTVGTSFEPCIIEDSNGKYWLTYNTYWGIYITSSDDFVNWDSSTEVVSGFMAGPSLIQDSAGKYWVAYYYHGGNWPVYITSSSNGTSWDSPIEIVSGQDDGYYNARNPELIQDSTGTYWMTYGTVDQGGKHDIALISSLDGVSWGSPVIVAGGDSDDGYTSSIIQDVSGMYWVVFPSDRSGAWNLWITSITAQEIGLFAYWKFDEGSGFIAGDSSGNGKDGIIDGATWTTGKIGDALSFDGFDDWVDVPDDISTKHITLEAWIYPTGFDDGPGDQGNAIIQRSTGGAGAPGDRSWSWRLRIMPRSHLAQFQAAGPNTGVGSVVAPTALVQNRWYHLAATYDGNVMKIYVDGEVKATNSNLDGPLETYHLIPVAIGCLEGWGLQHFQGIIDEVRVYGRALASEEVAQHAGYILGVISGVVTLDDVPLAGVPVYLLPAMGPGRWNSQVYDNMALGIQDDPANYALQTRQTTDAGYYQFAGISVGEYEVAACPTECPAELELRRANLAGAEVTVDFDMWGIDQQYNVTCWGSYPRPSTGESTVITYWIDPSLGPAWNKAIRYGLELWSQISRDCDGSSVPYMLLAASPKDIADIRFLPGSLPANKGAGTSLAGLPEWVAHWLLFQRNLIFVVFNTENLHSILAFGTDESPEPRTWGIAGVDSETRWVQYYIDHDIGGQICMDQVRVAVHEIGHALGLGEAPDIRQYSIMRSEAWSNNEWGRFLGWGDIVGIHKLYTSTATASPLAIIATCPVDLFVQDPQGHTIDKWHSSIPDSWYSEVDQDGEGSLDDSIVVQTPVDGVYSIEVIAEAGISPETEAAFSLYVCGAQGSVQLVSESPISQLPREFWIAREGGKIAYDLAVFEPPVSNVKFVLKKGRIVPIKFHIVDCLGAIVNEQRNINLEVTGPAPSGDTSTYIFSLADDTLKFDPFEWPPHYVAIFDSKSYPVVHGECYAATAKEDGAPIGSIRFEVIEPNAQR